ncbi:replication protein A 70 kDa dna-binding subunit [Trifolium medium]|uniref:Replication protein A 70 kDa dna-binding subunit n=1 Tax=Trifolium medium TaxID=97028 RepID=A0A392NAK0_9FABA|nr:replication protein A 70 kDa dna-binding subunit [Trifolium medium]
MRIWQEVGMGDVIERRIQTVTSVSTVMFDICKTEETHVAGLVAVVAFMIWSNALNQQRCITYSYQYKCTTTQWQCPTKGWWKCNVDASFHEAAGYTGWGWYIRNRQGNFIVAGCNWIREKLTTIEGEAMTLLEAICEAATRGWNNMVFESDSKIVVDAIHAKQYEQS